MNIKIEYNLYKIRIRANLSVRKLAERSGISKSMISAIENNKCNPSIIVICKLAIALNVKPNALYKYEIM